jgi:hypothetical protein
MLKFDRARPLTNGRSITVRTDKKVTATIEITETVSGDLIIKANAWHNSKVAHCKPGQYDDAVIWVEKK